MTDNGNTKTQPRGAWVVHDSGHALALFGNELAAYRYANPLHAQVVHVGFGSEVPGAKNSRRLPGRAVVPVGDAAPAEVTT